jgi:hypothetical protein
MIVKRMKKVNTDKLKVGDQIKVRVTVFDSGYPGETGAMYHKEKHTATAIEDKGDKMLFLLDDCLHDARPVNENGGTEGGWNNSDLFKDLSKMQIELRGQDEDEACEFVTFKGGSKLTLLSIREVFGLDEDYKECDGQIEWMKDRRHRIADRNGEPYECWWLRSVVSATGFAFVGNIGGAGCNIASNAFGVRPAFAIKF